LPMWRIKLKQHIPSPLHCFHFSNAKRDFSFYKFPFPQIFSAEKYIGAMQDVMK